MIRILNLKKKSKIRRRRRKYVGDWMRRRSKRDYHGVFWTARGRTTNMTMSVPRKGWGVGVSKKIDSAEGSWKIIMLIFTISTKNINFRN